MNVNGCVQVRTGSVGSLLMTFRHSYLLFLAAASLLRGQAETDFLGGIRQLTFEGKRSGEGYFSADGSQMIFQSERETDNPFYQIYLMNLETGDQ